jgi:hypothetical protein
MVAMRYLSIDIGIKNFAYCVLLHDDDKKTSIESWGVVNVAPKDIAKPTFHETARELVKHLKEMFTDTFDCVLIENQPVQKNPVMKSIQIIVYTYFLTSGIHDIRFVSACNKLKLKSQPEGIDEMCTSKVKYTRNKQKSVILCRHYLMDDAVNLAKFEQNKKSPDMADAYCQGMYVLERCV